jgi:beta-glucosidase
MLCSVSGLLHVCTGCNLEDNEDSHPVYLAITDAVAQGKLSETVVRQAVKPLFYTRMRLGLFDPPEMVPYAQLNASVVVQSESHRQLTLETAMRSFVLLKNSNNFLPLATGYKVKQLAVSGLVIYLHKNLNYMKKYGSVKFLPKSKVLQHQIQL